MSTSRTPIEWTDRTWSPTRGCSRVSDGCTRCYAERVARRFSGKGGAYEGLLHSNGAWNGKIRLVEEALDEPLHWRKPCRVFVDSMSDLFHEHVPTEFIDRVFAVMALSPQHTFQVLTKRPASMAGYCAPFDQGRRIWRVADEIACEKRLNEFHPSWQYLYKGERSAPWPLPNVWLGVSVENQQTADERIPLLLQTPAALRFLSCEPLLGPIDLRINQRGAPHNKWGFPDGPCGYYCDPDGAGHVDHQARIDWVIVGGESGPGARPMHPDWARSLRDQCIAAGVPFFFKQWGHYAPWLDESRFTNGGAERKPHVWVDRRNGAHGLCWIIDHDGNWSNWTGEPPKDTADTCVMAPVGKAAAGRLLDWRTWDQLPETRSAL